MMPLSEILKFLRYLVLVLRKTGIRIIEFPVQHLLPILHRTLRLLHSLDASLSRNPVSVYPLLLQGLKRILINLSSLSSFSEETDQAEGIVRNYLFVADIIRVLLRLVRQIARSLDTLCLKFTQRKYPTERIRVLQDALCAVENIYSNYTQVQSEKKCPNRI